MLFGKSLDERRCRSMVPSIWEIYVLGGLCNLVSVMEKNLFQKNKSRIMWNCNKKAFITFKRNNIDNILSVVCIKTWWMGVDQWYSDARSTCKHMQIWIKSLELLRPMSFHVQIFFVFAKDFEVFSQIYNVNGKFEMCRITLPHLIFRIIPMGKH